MTRLGLEQLVRVVRVGPPEKMFPLFSGSFVPFSGRKREKSEMCKKRNEFMQWSADFI